MAVRESRPFWHTAWRAQCSICQEWTTISTIPRVPDASSRRCPRCVCDLVSPDAFQAIQTLTRLSMGTEATQKSIEDLLC